MSYRPIYDFCRTEAVISAANGGDLKAIAQVAEWTQRQAVY